MVGTETTHTYPLRNALLLAAEMKPRAPPLLQVLRLLRLHIKLSGYVHLPPPLLLHEGGGEK